MLSRDQLLSRLRALLPELSNEFGVASLTLFGSFARDEQTETSDVDLIVEFSREPTLFTLASVRLYLIDRLHLDVDLGTLASLRPSLREQAQRESLRVA